MHIEQATMCVEVNRTTRETKIVESQGRDSDSECIYLPIQAGDWIKMPVDLVLGQEHGYRTLKEVLSQLSCFVMGMVIKLLCVAQIFSDGGAEVSPEGGDKWCSTKLKSLLLKHLPCVKWQPIKLPLPVVQIDRKNSQQMMNELKLHIAKVEKQFNFTWHPDGDGHNSILQVSCGNFKDEFSSKYSSKELAAKSAIDKFIRLGLVQSTSSPEIPLASNTVQSVSEQPVVVLCKNEKKNYTQLLNEFIDKKRSQKFDIKKSETIVHDEK